MNKVLVAVLVVFAVVVLGGIVFISTRSTQDVGYSENTMKNAVQPEQTNPPANLAPSSPANPENSVPSQLSVSINGFAFDPATLSLHVGDSVTWTNEDSVSHTVSSDSGSELASPRLSRGQTYIHTFTMAGTYNYHCAVHPGMKAKVVVS